MALPRIALGRSEYPFIRILCIHPSAELYGSDRVFLQTVEALRELLPGARIRVLLPSKGPLFDLLQHTGTTVEVYPLFVLRRKELLDLPFRVPALIRMIVRSRKLLKAHDLTLINTIVVADFLIATMLTRSKTLTHVHELPKGVEGLAFLLLVRFSRGRLIFVSEAVRAAFGRHSGRKSDVIPNGVSRIAARPATSPPPLNILMIGRFNSWKGQILLVRAVALLRPEEQALIRLRLLGGSYVGQEIYRSRVEAEVSACGLGKLVELFEFDSNPATQYAWSHLVVVPSLKPEPFGLVAIEAMSACRPVIAAAHGGLLEIIQHGVTGLLVPPRDEAALAEALRFYIRRPDLVATHGKAAFQRYEMLFTSSLYKSRISAAAKAVLSRGTSGDQVNA